MTPSENGGSLQVNLVIGRLGKFYGLLLGLTVVAVLTVSAIDGLSHYSLLEWLNIGLGVGLLGFIAFGLRRRQPWFVPLILFSSAYSMIPVLVGGAETLVDIILDLGWASVSIFQL